MAAETRTTTVDAETTASTAVQSADVAVTAHALAHANAAMLMTVALQTKIFLQ